MTRRAFYVEGLDGSEPEPVLEGALAHQLRQVLRLTPGAKIELRSGRGDSWRAEITECHKKSVTVRLLDRLTATLEPPLEITLAMAYARSDRMDQVVRQAVELGIRRFAAFPASRSQYGLSSARERKKVERWRKIAQEAMCQCGRTVLPDIRCFDDLDRFLAALEDDWKQEALRILGLETEDQRSLGDLRSKQPSPPEIVVMVGCEGGWTGREAERLLVCGFQSVRLGPRILRLETAAVALLSCVQLLWGDLDGNPASSDFRTIQTGQPAG